MRAAPHPSRGCKPSIFSGPTECRVGLCAGRQSAARESFVDEAKDEQTTAKIISALLKHNPKQTYLVLPSLMTVLRAMFSVVLCGFGRTGDDAEQALKAAAGSGLQLYL